MTARKAPAALLLVVVMVVLTTANTVHGLTTEHPRPIELQPSNDLGDLILAGGRGPAVRGGLFAHLAEAGGGDVLITPPTVWMEEEALRAIAGVELVVEDYDPEVSDEIAERLLELPHGAGTYNPYIRPETPWSYAVIHPPQPGPVPRWRVVVHGQDVLIVPEPLLDGGEQTEATP